MKALLVDDEAPARARLRRLIESLDPSIEIVGEAANGVAALEKTQELRPDVVFLDIEMPELDGLAVASCLRHNGPMIVFVTAYDQHALKAFEVAAVDYLVKPVAEARLKLALTKIKSLRQQDLGPLIRAAAESPEGERRRLAARVGSKFVVVDPAKVSAVVAKDHYAAVLCEGRELLTDDPLDAWTEKLSAKHFVRVHRSAILNLDFLRELQREGDRKYVAVLSDAAGTRLPVSRERLAELKARLGLSGDDSMS